MIMIFLLYINPQLSKVKRKVFECFFYTIKVNWTLIDYVVNFTTLFSRSIFIYIYKGDSLS